MQNELVKTCYNLSLLKPWSSTVLEYFSGDFVSGILEVHDGVRDGDVQLENDLLDVEGSGQSIRQAQQTLCKISSIQFRN